ncbi:PilN domain-containing protein, partial [Planctomycetota bacterium]
AIDFYGIKSPVKSVSQRVFVVATDGQKISNSAKAFLQKGINVKVIEPALTAYTRACNAKKTTAGSASNTLYATVIDGILDISVYITNTLDFVRTKPVEADPTQKNKYLEWLAEEINAVLKFHEFRTSKKSQKWKIVIVSDNLRAGIKRKEKQLSDILNSCEVQIRTSEQSYLDTPVAEDVSGHKPSAVAVGLAMGLLYPPGTSVSINLLPSDVILSKSKERKTLLIGNIAAAVFVSMIICIAFYQAKAEKLNSQIRNREQIRTTYDTHALLEDSAELQVLLSQITDRLNLVKDVIEMNPVLEWGQVLNEISHITPRTVRINEFSSSDNSSIQINGQAISYEAVNLFVEWLNNCQSIDTASLIGSRSNRSSDNLIGYSINCKLVQ